MNEQMSLFDFIDWKVQVRQMLADMVTELELPKDSLYLLENLGRDGEKVTSFSICIYEPDYPEIKGSSRDSSRNSIILNIKEGKNLEILISSTQLQTVGELRESVIKNVSTDENALKLVTSSDNPELIPFLKKNVIYGLDHYESKAKSFGCCSHFLECSNAKHCVHENKLYGKACSYRHHLDAGEIFYGENKNI